MKTNLKTRRQEFHDYDGYRKSEVLEVKGGLPAEIALNLASNSLEAIESMLTGEDGVSPAAAYGIRDIVIQTKGLVDSVWNSIELGEEEEIAQ